MGSFLTHHAGYWSLIVFSIELYAMLYFLWLRTTLELFAFVLRKLSWIMPLALYLTYLIGDKVPNPRTVHSFDQLYVALLHMFVRNSEILAARALPRLTILIGFLSTLPRLITCIRSRFRPRQLI